MVVHNPLVRSVAIVAGTWWVILTVAGIWMYSGVFFSLPGLVASFSYVAYGLLTAILGVAAGVAVVIVAQVRERMARAKALKAAGRLGMLCTLGGMPIPVHPAMRQVQGPLPDWFLQETEHGKILVDWVERSRQKHPQHAQALMALLRVFCSYRVLPASHVPGGHGGKTLVDHTMRVAARMLKEAPKFKYEGLVTRYGREPWGDAAFTFDPDDPMIPIVGVAHDIGKLQTFVTDSSGKIVSAAPKHDLVGSRMLATMDEIKALPIADQAALHMAVSHYHHPSDYPLDAQGRIASDRSVALMMLLIKADKWSGKEEAGQSLTPDQYAAYLRYVRELGEELSSDEEEVIRSAETAQQAAGPAGARNHTHSSTPITDERMREILLKIITNPTVVFTAMPKGNSKPVGQVCNTNYPEWAWEALAQGQPLGVEQQQQLSQYIERLVVIHEQRLRQVLAKALGLSEVKKLGDGRAAIIVHALRVLHEMGVLYTDTDGGHISPESAIYKVDLVNHKTGASIAKWTAILLRPVADLEALAKGGIHPSLVKVVMPVWRDRVQRAQVDGVEVTEPGAGEEYLHDRVVLDDEGDADEGDEPVSATASSADQDVAAPEALSDAVTVPEPAASHGQTVETPRRGWAEFDAGPDDFRSFPTPDSAAAPDPVQSDDSGTAPADPTPASQPQQPTDRHSHTPEQVQSATESLIASVMPANPAEPTTPTSRAKRFAEDLKRARSKPGLDRYKKP